jgi:predicted dehydrogenase
MVSAMADRIRWGILSTGHIATSFVSDLRLLHDAEVTAVGSRSTAAAEAFAQRFGIGTAHGSWRALAEDPNVDVVYVATPHHAHAEATLLCLRVGKAVLTEKPITLDTASAETLVETARSAGLFLMEAMWMRCFPAIRRIAGLIADGAIGEVTAIHADFGLQGPFEQTHRLRARALGGGALLDLGIYPLTFAYLFLGAPSSVQAWADLNEEGVDDNTGLLLGYDSGALATLTCGVVGDTPRRAIITGTLGRIEVPRDFYRPARFTLIRGDLLEEVDMPYEGLGYHFEASEVQRCLREGLLESPLIPHSETLAIMAIMDAVREKVGITYDS